MKQKAVLAGAMMLVLSPAVGAAGRGAGAEAGETAAYQVSVARDAGGVPHITASDWGSLAFGQGYALAEDRACTLLDQVIKVRGERARWFGPGENDEHVNSDFAYRHLGLWDDAPTRWADQTQRVQDVVDGYVAGFNARIDQHEVVGWCAGAPWIGPITSQDLYAYVSDLLLAASSRNFIQEIGAAQPPAASGSPDATTAVTEGFAGSLGQQAPGASNGWAFGADATATGNGLLLANPHYPWEGELRFWESHLMIPGELNVYGVGLSGLPGIQIGFNEAVAWTHTVSAGHRFTLYRYDLEPSDPTVYLVDDQPQAMVSNEITIEVGSDDGSTTELSRTLYSTHHGPVLNIDPLGWTTEQAIAIGDVNLEITRGLEQWLGMDAATSMDEFQAVHAETQGIPWVNTIATSADGRAWYADTSATPNLSPEALDAWAEEIAGDGLLGLVYNDFGVVMLDGSDSLYDWVEDPAAPAPGLVPYAALPQLERSDYVFNANDSYWLTHPDELLTGYSPLHGREGIDQSPRTRTNVMLLEDHEGTWTIDDVQSALFSDRAQLAELLREPLVQACTTTPTVDLNRTAVDLTAACDTLAGWDGTFTLDARGAIVFREWLSRFDYADRVDAGRLFSDGFDAADPAGTPSVPVTDRADWLVELGSVVQLLGLVGIPVDAPLGDYQFEVRTGDRIPIHGGTNIEGTANIVGCCAASTVLEPAPEDGDRVNDFSELRDLPGYAVSDGASFVLTVEYTSDGPVGEGFLTYGNPDDAADPAYRAGLEAFSAGEWRPFLFTEAAMAAAGLQPVELTG